MNQAMAKAMDLGFRFRLSDTELFHELRFKIIGEASPRSPFIPKLDLAELDPSQIPGLLKMPLEDKKWYFFCDREKSRANGNQYKRKGKSGSWKITGKGVEIVDSENNKGKKQILVHQEGQKRKGTEWVIHQYSLNDPLVNNQKKTMKAEETTKSKRVKKDADIAKSLKGEPSGYTMSDVENPITSAEIVWEGGHAESNYGSVLPQNCLPHNEGESSYDVNSIGKTSHTANSVVSNSVIDSIQPPNSAEGHRDMPTSHVSVESEMSMEELMDTFRDADENINGPETTDGSQKTILELLRNFSTDDDVSGKAIDDNNKESSPQISSELTSFEFVVEELGILYNTDDYIRGILDSFLNRSCQKTSENQHFLDNPVSRNMDAEGADGQVDVLPFAPGGTPPVANEPP